MIEFESVYKQFGALPVLRDVSLDLPSRSGIALLGPNGCGKTTLIKIILGMVIPDRGIIRVGGKNIQGDYRYRESIGYMPQIGRYPQNMRVGQVIEMIRRVRPFSGQVDMELYEAFQIGKLEHKYMGTLSGGTRQKVSATLAFLFQPEVLILDEPTAGLDPVSSLVLKEKVQRSIQAGKLVLVTSHLLGELDEIVDTVIFMQDGGIRFRHTLEEMYSLTGKARLGAALAQILQSEAYAQNS